MQPTSGNFTLKAINPIRYPIGRLYVAWDKTYQSGLDFFTIGVSTIGGIDVIKGEGNTLTESDKYEYTDESDDLILIEYEREALEPLQSVNRAILDVILDNNDNRYTPEGGSDIDDFILPRRPIRAYLGFGKDAPEYVQVFTGQIVDFPEIDERENTVRIHCRDFFDTLWNFPIQNTVMYTDMRTDEIIEELLQLAGLTAGQYDLQVGSTTIPFAYFKKGQKLGESIRKLAEAELGRFYLDETGIYRYENRYHWALSTSVVAILQEEQVIAADKPNIDGLVNVVEITAHPRQVMDNQLIWQTTNPKEILAGETLEFFANFEDPVTGVDTPNNEDSTVTLPIDATSYFMANGLSNYEGGDLGSDISLDDFDIFAESAKLVFTNNGASTAYLKVVLWGTPAKQIAGPDGIFVRVADDAAGESIEKYGEQPVKIDNDFIQSANFAQSLGQILIADRKEPADYQHLTVIGNPAFQIGDLVDWRSRYYNIIKIKGRLSASAGLTQDITMVQRTLHSYFVIGLSTIGGPDEIAP